MNFDTNQLSLYLTSCQLLFEFAKSAKNRQRKKKLKDIVFNDLNQDIKNMNAAYNNFLFYNYSLYGSYVVGSFIEPINPDEFSDKLLENIETSYSEVVSSLSQVKKTLVIHKDLFQKIFENDSEKMMLFDIIINIIGENGTIDYDYLETRKEILFNQPRRKVEKTFAQKLAEKQKNLKCLSIIDGTKTSKEVKNLMINLQKDPQYYELIQKYG